MSDRLYDGEANTLLTAILLCMESDTSLRGVHIFLTVVAQSARVKSQFSQTECELRLLHRIVKDAAIAYDNVINSSTSDGVVS